MRKGFTLIELLVVIAIIGILSTTVLVSLGGARSKAKDAKRQSDIAQIHLAMELDYSDDEKYSQYTPAPAEWQTAKIPKDIGKYLDAVPKDPSGVSYAWLDNSPTATTGFNSQHYCVLASLETGGFFAGSEQGTKKLDVAPSVYPCW